MKKQVPAIQVPTDAREIIDVDMAKRVYDVGLAVKHQGSGFGDVEPALGVLRDVASQCLESWRRVGSRRQHGSDNIPTD
jgi:hypothetical protein